MWEEKLSVLSRDSLSVISLATDDIFKANTDPREFLLYTMTLKATSMMARPIHRAGLYLSFCSIAPLPVPTPNFANSELGDSLGKKLF